MKKKKAKVVVGDMPKTKELILEQMNVLPDHKKIQMTQEYYRENPPKIGVQAPLTEEIQDLSVSTLMKGTLPQYQRGYQHTRCEAIVNSIIRFGYMGSSVITVVKNKRGKIIFVHDGRHRLVAFWILGVKTIRASVVQFQNENDEIDYFNMVNAAQKPLTNEQRTLNNFQANHPLALLIYDLGYFNERSKWHDKIGLLGIDESPKGKISVANFRKILNWAGLGLRRRMEGESDIRALRKMEKMDPEDILNGVNAFHDWFYQFAHYPHYPGDVHTKDKVIISFLEFFYCALRQNSPKAVLSPERILATSINKFRLFNFEQLQRYDASKAPNVLFEVFNGKGEKRRTNTIERIGI